MFWEQLFRSFRSIYWLKTIPSVYCQKTSVQKLRDKYFVADGFFLLKFWRCIYDFKRTHVRIDNLLRKLTPEFLFWIQSVFVWEGQWCSCCQLDRISIGLYARFVKARTWVTSILQIKKIFSNIEIEVSKTAQLRYSFLKKTLYFLLRCSWNLIFGASDFHSWVYRY